MDFVHVVRFPQICHNFGWVNRNSFLNGLHRKKLFIRPFRFRSSLKCLFHCEIKIFHYIFLGNNIRLFWFIHTNANQVAWIKVSNFNQKSCPFRSVTKRNFNFIVSFWFRLMQKLFWLYMSTSSRTAIACLSLTMTLTHGHWWFETFEWKTAASTCKKKTERDYLWILWFWLISFILQYVCYSLTTFFLSYFAI